MLRSDQNLRAGHGACPDGHYMKYVDLEFSVVFYTIS
jgi:hypothetical protein